METFANKENITIKDIAKIAKVSYSTVSRSLNDSNLVAETTKKKIQKIAKQLGFEFDASARGLVTRRVGTIGIILPNNFNNFNIYTHHVSLMNQLRTVLEKEDYDLIVSFYKNHFNNIDNIKRLINRRKVDGLIILKPRLDNDTLDYIIEKSIPFVFSHYPLELNHSDVESVYPDNFYGGSIVAKHYLDRGYKKFVCINSITRDLEFNLRIEGFRNIIFSEKSDNISLEILYGDLSFESGYKLTKDNFDIFKKSEAVFSINDMMAFGIMKALNEVGLRIPDDIAIIGYDNSDLCEFFTPKVTSVHQRQEIIALKTCERLISKILNKDNYTNIRQFIIKPELVIRESSG